MIEVGKSYRTIYVLESRDYWGAVANDFDVNSDLVLTFDFGLKHLVESIGGSCHYIDQLCSVDEMQRNNFLAANFFKNWHYDRSNNDIFTSKNIAFGFALRIEIWSEYLYYVRLRANIEKIKKCSFERIVLYENKSPIRNIFDDAGINYSYKNTNIVSGNNAYFFDIHKYMSSALHGKSAKDFLRSVAIFLISNVCFYLDTFFKKNTTSIFIQHYYPTDSILRILKEDKSVRIITPTLIPQKGLKRLKQRLIPMQGSKNKYRQEAASLLNNFKKNKHFRLVLDGGIDISDGAYAVIEKKIETIIPEALRMLHSVIAYLKKIPISLEVMIANIGLLPTIVDCVLKANRVPSYLIINGLMLSKFGDESKYASFINSYGSEIKRNYFQGMDNVYALGDPRMDSYARYIETSTKVINRIYPTIGIGTSAFNNLDLISNSAIEFDFLYELLTAMRELKEEGVKFTIAIKVRSNGVLEQYEFFVAEYFPNLDIKLHRDIPMVDFLSQTDFYISIYSQTVFEASCLGIPALYFKNDNLYLDSPFDGESELVTAKSKIEIKNAFLDFLSHDNKFDRFLDKSVMEKYLGPIDGESTQRNLNFINKILARGVVE